MKKTLSNAVMPVVLFLSQVLLFVLSSAKASLLGRNVKRVSALTIVACLAALHFSTREVQPQGASCLVTTTSGDVQGIDFGASCAFLGIPYAASTAGGNRWRPPQPREPWAPAVLNATTPPPSCPQVTLPAGTLGGSEDCLKLNIWVSNPPPSSPAPVIVWLHTGAFFGGTANIPANNGRRLAEETGAIVVVPNYRLGPFGFLAHNALAVEDPDYPSSGNYGLLDQRAALVWVRDNIAQFGGDPENVTLAGTSAGGDSVGLHLVSPESGGLFHRAILQSGSPTVRWTTHSEATAQGDAFAAALGCTDPSQVLACMRSKTRDQVLLGLSQSTQQVVEPAGRVYWNPVVDGVEIPNQPRILFEEGAFHRVPTIIGTNRDEGWGRFVDRSFPSGVSLAQYEAWVLNEFGPDGSSVLAAYPAANFSSPVEAMARLLGDGQFVCEARRLARLLERTGTATFLYSFDYEVNEVSTFFNNHVTHGIESNIIFGNNYVQAAFTPTPHVLNEADLALHAAMAGYWTRFAAAGNPNSDDDSIVHWPAFKHPTGEGRGPDKYIIFDLEIREAMRPREEQCDFWEQFFFRTMLGGLPASVP